LLLAVKGYRPRHRNWQGPAGELDLVVERGGELVFVEVKTRRGDLYGGAAAAVGGDKRDALARTAAAYLGRYGLWSRPCRFDVVTVERTSRLPFWRLRHIRNAFQPDLGRRL
jgi:putative endonuclease